ncbi:SUMF1/EgtB/PvdO family nonheme iron enzyme [Haliscomenobacter hydrossis]|uniref:Sulphatase-modifying factor protein n=1 Tax=Haliscomenobacter hydrossis (strain ATCC 27775 / DSM 1100 / LMG 10767 / O) TaxID=760192 RepID=F4KVQ0_HALH1|nr:SUMF1/EgtB/PvdO family nonheme iron enzyme [Haliscomenobacter hydrossis]AEE52507.1 Sulphatase-modifying factor protein [Haliscomenobacter hydrossis DSM 1100]
MKKRPFLLVFTLFLCTLSLAQRSGRDYAVFFYVTDFKPGWAKLPETQVEATAIKNELSTNFTFVCEAVPNPTKQQIRNKIRQYNALLGSNDQIFFFFSMHGHYAEQGDRGYLIASDGLANDTYGDTWLSYDELRSDLGPCRAKHVLLALDACHSGSFGIRSKGSPNAPIYKLTEDCSTRINKTMQYQGRQFCTSGNKNAKTPAKSLFAERLLEALRKGGEGGIIHFDDLEYWLGKVANPEPEGGTFVGHNAGDFVFVKKNACSSNSISPEEEKVWQTAMQRNSVEAYDVYLTLYPEGKYISKAKELKQLAPQPWMTEDGQKWVTGSDDGMILVKGGSFMMGCTSEQQDCANGEKPTRQVTLDDFYLSPYEVTQKKWQQVMGTNPSFFKNCDECPVEQVSWYDVQTFLQKLNGQTGKQYRLPTEAEWEYAAREGGKQVLFGNGKNIADPNEINFNASTAYKKPYSMVGSYRAKTTPVGSFTANKLGLYDMSGNVWEWCSDWCCLSYYENNPSVNPTGDSSGLGRVCRGGSWFDGPEFARVANRAPPWLDFPQGARVANRYDSTPDDHISFHGFRLARTP